MLKILCSGIGYERGQAGIAEYIRETVSLLAEEHRVDLIMLEGDAAVFPVRHPKHLRVITYPEKLRRPISNVLWHSFILPYRLPADDYDFTFLPAGNRRLFWHHQFPTLATCHDLAQLHYPVCQSKLHRLYHNQMLPFLLRRIDRIIAISESTRQDLINHYHIPPERIKVNYNGFNVSRFYPAVENDDQEILHKYDLVRPYILYVNRIEHPVKNHLNLIKAYDLLPERLRNQFDLVFAGSFAAGGKTVKNYVEASANANKIHFLGFVPADELPAVYRNAAVYAFPSFYEGFGIPLMEAMSCGVPVICSNRSSLPEIGGDAVLTFNPEEPESIRHQLETTLSDETIRNEMIRKGYRRKEQFSWQRHVDNLIQIFEELKEQSKLS